MSGCCDQCFGDRNLSRNFFSGQTAQPGTCDFCDSINQRVLDPTSLRDSFELLLGAYRQDDSGHPLLHWFRRDWMLLASPTLSDRQAKRLIGAIFGDESLANKCFVPSNSDETDTLSQWEEFREELMFKNRYFPDSTLNLDRLGELLQYLLLHEGEFSNTWHRARIQKEGSTYSPEEMLAPPARLAIHGRANPAGIPYLYLASSVRTAVSEVRPHPGETVTVARFEISNRLKLLDLRNPRSTVSPFDMADEPSVGLLRKDLALLERLGQELTQPVLPEAGATEYVPSQFLCEFIKKAEYAGLLYASSLVDGINLALFDPKNAEFREISHHTVMRVSVELQANEC